MKNLLPRLVLAVALGSLLISIQPVLAQGTAFTYQGRLTVSDTPANGTYDFEFVLFDAGTNGNFIAGPVTNSAIAVSNGLFTVPLDFGSPPSVLARTTNTSPPWTKAAWRWRPFRV